MTSSLVSLLPLSFRLVFSRVFYIALTIAIAFTFWIIFNLFEQLIFFWPVWVFYLPEDALLGFVITKNIIAILLGILISMNTYVIRNLRLKITNSSLFSGTGLIILSSTCVSCSSIGFLLISTFGGLGILISNFLSTYQLLLRLLSIAVLLFALYSVHKRITKICVINYRDVKEADN